MTSVQFNHEVTVLKPVWVPLQSNWNGRSAEWLKKLVLEGGFLFQGCFYSLSREEVLIVNDFFPSGDSDRTDSSLEDE